MREPLRFSGVMPANILPFNADLSIDEPAYRAPPALARRHPRASPASSPTATPARSPRSTARGAPALAGHRARRGRRRGAR